MAYQQFADDAPVPQTVRSRNWVFTWNNPTEAVETMLQAWALPKWIIYGREVAPTTGTPHLQGAFILPNAVRWNFLHDLFPEMWLEPMRGKPSQAAEYCMKQDEDYFEQGERPLSRGEAGGQGNKRKWEEAKTLAVAGDVDDIEASIYIPYFKSLQAIAARHQRKPDNLASPCGVWYYGKTGTGKSHAAREENPVHYLKGPNKWWCGYDKEPVVLIEDIDRSHEFLGFNLKIWADKYPFQAEVKGSSMCIRPGKIVVTSNYHPKEIFTNEGILLPILRRFKVTRFATLGDLANFDEPVEEIRQAFVPGFVPYVPRPVINPIPDDVVDDESFNFNYL